MGQGQLPPIGAEVTPLPPMGGEVPPDAAPAMNFAVVNGQRVPVDAGPALVRAAEQFYEKSPIGGAVTLGKGVVNAVAHPLDTWLGTLPLAETAKGLVRAQWNQGVEAAQKAKTALHAARGGNYVEANLSAIEAMGHGLAAVLPLLGPMAADVGEHGARGDVAGMFGGAAGMLSPFAYKEMTASRRGPAAPAPAATETARLTPEDAASNALARERGIRLDAATATGSRTLRAVQKIAGNTLGGEGMAERAIRDQDAGLTRVGRELAVETGGATATPYGAGQALKGSVRQLMTDLRRDADRAYGRLREIEEQPESISHVPKILSPAERKGIETRQQASLGYAPESPVLAELRRIRAEMDALPFVKRTWNEVPDKSGNAAGGDAQIVAGAAGAPVYNDILESSPGSGGTNYTRADVIRAIDSALETGHYTNAAKGALTVAERRLRGDRSVSRPSLPPEAGDTVVPMQRMALAVDVGSLKGRLRPIYQRLLRESELAPLMGGKANALRALDRLVNGPDHAPLTIVDAALGDLKTLARAELPELRTPGQGVAALVVRDLDALVRKAAADYGPDVINALEEGRGATREKHRVAADYKLLKAEPVKAWEQMTLPHDGGVDLLKRVSEFAPMRMADVARAWLDHAIDDATVNGRFENAGGLHTRWHALGAETKQILFPSEAHRAALDQFFLLAKRMKENPNPSGTALTMRATNLALSVGTYPLAKLLYSPMGVRALTRVFNAPVGRTRSAVAARRIAWLELVAAARSAGVPLPADAATTTEQDQR